MKPEYFSESNNFDDPEFISVLDELPLWSAPFGMKILDMVNPKKFSTILDIGCGLGFPLLEIAQRMGKTCSVIGIDPWEKAIERVNKKIGIYGIDNVKTFIATAETLPFKDESFDLIVSNNGLNNVKDFSKSLQECHRTGKKDSRLLFSVNLEKTMIEFYEIFRNILLKNNLNDRVKKLDQHIHDKRRPVEEIKNLLDKTGFIMKNIVFDEFIMRFTDGTAFLNHFLIRLAFREPWEEILDEFAPVLLKEIETEMNIQSEKKGELVITIPYAIFDYIKQ